jgi:hypothetical protein
MTPVSPELALSHPVPGIAGEMNTWTITGAEPGAIITFVYGFKGGGAVINTECDLLDAVIQLDDAKYMGSAIADEAGVATLTLFVPELARELPGVMIQAFDAMNCNESQLSVVVFE